MKKLFKISQFLIILVLFSCLPALKNVKAAELAIQNLSVENITDSEVIISWSTNMPSFYLLQYGLTNEYGQQIKGGEAKYTHEIKLSNLTPKKTYHFKIVSHTADDYRTYTFDQTFKTKKFIDEENPELLELRNPLVTDKTAYIYFQTDESVSTTLTYWDENSPKKIKSVKKNSNSQNYTNFTLKGLKYNTTYIYKITIKDKSENQLRLTERSFRTENPSFKLNDFYVSRVEPIDANSPLIKEDSFVAKITTTRPAVCTLNIGRRSIKEAGFYQWNHEFTIDGLKPNKSHDYYVKCRDYLGNYHTSQKYHITTKGPLVLGYSVKSAGEPFGGKKFTLVKTADSPRVYALVNGQKYHIKNPEIFNSYNLNGVEIKTITADKLNSYPETRIIIRESTGEKYFLYLDKNMKKQILSDKVNKSYQLNKNQTALTINETDFFSYLDLWLVKTESSPAVYLIRDGVKRPINSWDVFLKNNWAAWQIGIINQTDLDSYITGSTLY